MSLLDMDEDDAQPTLQVSPGALLSEEQPWGKECKKEKRKVGGLSLGRTKPRDQTSEKGSKKGKHARNRSGSRTPPDSPRADRITRGKGLPSPNVKGHRKRYSQLGLDLSTEESEEEEDDQTYFTNQAVANEATLNTSNQVPFSIEQDSMQTTQPTSPGSWNTVQFPVQFEESNPKIFPMTAFEPQPPKDSTQSPTVLDVGGPWGVPSSAPSSDPPSSVVNQGQPSHDEEENIIPDTEWRVSNELLTKCRKQFKDLQPTHGRLQGDQARSFFIQSHLPNADLSAIWRLADIDHDNALSENEFCVAMKLVLLRRKGYSLPTSLPLTLKDSISIDRAILPQLRASHTVAELPFSQSPHPSLADISQKSEPQLNTMSLLVDLNDNMSTSCTIVERDEPAVATIISLEDDNNTKLSSQSFTEAAIEPMHTNVRRAHSLKEFTPPSPSHDISPPPSPFSPPPNTTSDTTPIISLLKPSPKASKQSKDKSGYHTLSTADVESDDEEEIVTDQIAIGKDRGHGRSTSLDLNKMIATSNVLSDMPAAEPPRPPPKPVPEDNDLSPQVRGRYASTGSISSTGPTLPSSVTMDTATSALLLSGTTRPIPARKAPLLPPVPKPRKPPPPRKDDNSSSLLRNKSELQTTIRSLKDTNATFQTLNRELEEKLFALMEDRVQLAREVELARQMQIT